MGVRLAVGKLPQTCVLCRVSSDHRNAWGCDSPTSYAQATIQCPQCGGIEGGQCSECGGTGVWAYYDCPRKLLAMDKDATRAVDFFFTSLNPHKILPVGGGWLDQPATFGDAMDIVSGEYARIENENMKAAMKHGK